MIDWILILCMVNPVNQAVKCGVIESPTEAICITTREELDALDGIIATTSCRVRVQEQESADDIS